MSFNMSITQNLNNIKSQLPEHVTLVAVSKTKPVRDLMEAYNANQTKDVALMRQDLRLGSLRISP